MKKRNVLVFVLSLLLMMGMLPATVFADPPPAALWVNGVDITAAPANTVTCGEGTAVYDPATETLTLNNVTIDTGYSGNGIAAGDYFNDRELAVVLVGSNVIAPAAATEMNRGIYTFGELAISGEGSITITTKTLDTDYTCGIYAWGGCSISDATISMTDESPVDYGSDGIDVNMVGSYFLCEDATIQMSGYSIGINVPTGHINIDNSGIEIIGATRGVNGGTEIDDFEIKDSEIDCSVSGENAVAVANGCDILIDHSKLTLSSTSSNAIFSDAALSIKNGSEIDATGYYPALYGTST
ncbi:MAG TPA: hypothetical protein PKD52_03510 [Clostridiales bacterium]|nr:hypothetical protein [Clostridiales bacterium]